jgi:peptidoglycan/LPS O-acetylase OafA/YrhL
MSTLQRLPAHALQATTSGQRASPRFHEIDWVRAFIILALVPCHALGFFTANSDQYFGTGYSTAIGLSTLMTVGSWGIALLFLIAGAAASAMLARHTPHQFVSERFLRLLVPFVFASLTLIPLQNYLIVHTFPGVIGKIPAPSGWNPQFAESPVTFYLWFVGAYVTFLTHYTPQYEFIFWSHLWFIPRLFIISLLTLPLLLQLRGPRGAQFIARLAIWCERYRGGVFLFAVPLGLVLAVLGWQWQGWMVVGAPDTWNVLAQFVFYALIYLYGAVIYSDERLRQAVRRDGGVVALALGILFFIITQLPGVGNSALAHDYSAAGILVGFLRALAAWMCITGILGLSMRFLAFTNRVGRYLTDASYPFYVFHLAVLYLIGLPLLASGTQPLLAFLTMVVFTYVIAMGAYEVLVRRISPVRMLFGMKKKRSLPPPE